MKITVIGSGYVGLVTATCLAETGHVVIGVDADTEKIRRLKAGEVPIYEPGLEDLLDRNLKAKRLSFTANTAQACAGAEAIFLAVGTPPGRDGAADLSSLYAAAETVAVALTGPTVLVTKSTVPVGTGRKLWNLVQQKTKHGFDVVSNPEFLKEGDAINDFMKPDRVVVGCQSERARRVMTDIYEPFVRTDNPILFMDLESAEMTKYVANAFLATKISFMNEMARLCQQTGADIEIVRRGISFDRRIGHQFMFPGVGYGGSCFPKDIKALVALGQEKSVPLAILEAGSWSRLSNGDSTATRKIKSRLSGVSLSSHAPMTFAKRRQSR
jgi:UDPglucose 6-dehydrogenase